MYTPEEVTQAIVVLGFELNDDGTLKEGLKLRLNMAAELYRQKVAPVIITSGWYALNTEALKQYCEAVEMQRYLHDVHGSDIVVMLEPDSKSVPENILFTRIRFPNLTHLTVVAGKEFMVRTSFFVGMIFTDQVQTCVYGCEDGTGDPERQKLLVGDAMCTLKDMTPGDLSFLQPSWTSEGRLDSNWNDLRWAHHDCPYWRKVHPTTP